MEMNKHEQGKIGNTKNGSPFNSLYQSQAKSYYALEIPLAYMPIKIKNQLKSKGNTPYAYVVLGEKTSFGRQGSDFDLDNGAINPIHFTLWVQEGVVMIKDNGSRLGISVNGLKPIPGLKIIVEENDQISIGEMTLRLVKHHTHAPQSSRWEHCTFWSSAPQFSESIPLEEYKEDYRDDYREEYIPEIPPQMTSSISSASEIPAIPENRESSEEGSSKIKIRKWVKKEVYSSSSSTPSFIPSANPIMRFCALCIDIGITALIGMNLMGLKFILHLENLLAKTLLPSLEKYFSPMMGSFSWKGAQGLLVLFVLGYILLGLQRILFSFIFGVSLGEFCVGLKGDNGAVWNRLGGPIRNFVGMFTLPAFFILDFPCIIGKRTFKEWITSTKLSWNGLGQMLLGIFLLLPAVVLGNFLWPILIPQYKTPAVVVTTRTFEKKSAMSDLSPEEKMHLGELRLETSYALDFQYIKNPQFELFPTLEIIHGGSKGKAQVRPQMDFYLKGAQGEGLLPAKKASISLWGPSKLYTWIDKLIDRSMLFTSFYPNLHYFIKYSRFSPGNQGNMQLNKNAKLFPEVQSELIRLVKETLALDANNVLPFMLKNGPFLPGYLTFKNRLLSFFPNYKNQGIHASVIQYAQRPFLMLSLEQTQLQELMPSEYKEYLLIPLYGNESSIYKVQVEMGLEIGKFLTELSDYILWPDTSSLAPLSNQANGPFSLLDGLTNKKIQGKERMSFEESLYDFFYSSCQFWLFSTKALENLSEAKMVLSRNQEYVSKWASSYGKLSSHYQATLFVKRLEELAANIELAVQKDITSYFLEESDGVEEGDSTGL